MSPPVRLPMWPGGCWHQALGRSTAATSGLSSAPLTPASELSTLTTIVPEKASPQSLFGPVVRKTAISLDRRAKCVMRFGAICAKPSSNYSKPRDTGRRTMAVCQAEQVSEIDKQRHRRVVETKHCSCRTLHWTCSSVVCRQAEQQQPHQHHRVAHHVRSRHLGPICDTLWPRESLPYTCPRAYSLSSIRPNLRVALWLSLSRIPVSLLTQRHLAPIRRVPQLCILSAYSMRFVCPTMSVATEPHGVVIGSSRYLHR